MKEDVIFELEKLFSVEPTDSDAIEKIAENIIAKVERNTAKNIQAHIQKTFGV